MPRDLADVLHYLLPEPEADPPEPEAEPGTRAVSCSPAESPVRTGSPPDPAVLAIPIGDRDVVRAAFVWNLCVEVARRGAHASLVLPARDRESPLWAYENPGPLGVRLRFGPGDDLDGLETCARQEAARLPSSEPGLVLVRVPPERLREAGTRPGVLAWSLLFATPESRDLLEAYGLSKLVLGAHPEARLGLTVHGVEGLAEARQAYHRVSRPVSRRLGGEMASYGLILDDLAIFRAIADRRAVGLCRPQAAASRALSDVARLLLEDVSARVCA